MSRPLTVLRFVSNKKCIACAGVVICQYPDGLRPRERGAVVNFIKCRQSSSCASRRDDCDCSRRTALVACPWVVRAAMDRALPSEVLGPVLSAPCQSHLWVLLPWAAGLLHCSPVCLDLAVHRAHTALPTMVAIFGSVCWALGMHHYFTL